MKELAGYTPYKPLPKAPSGELTARQKEHIQSLVERYTKRTANSKRKTQEYRNVLADPRVVAGFRSQWKEMVYPIITVRSQGSKLWDVDGNEYIDILNGFGPIMLGHRPEFRCSKPSRSSFRRDLKPGRKRCSRAKWQK